MSLPRSLVARGSPHLSEWCADETLFGLCSRHHIVSGNTTARQTSLQLFGVRSGASWDLPRCLDAFVLATGALLGSAEDIAQSRTVLGFYLPFQDRASQQELLAAARTEFAGAAKGQLGLMASRYGASHVLKACCTCLERDKRTQKVASWRLQHQWPASWICLEHLEPLVACSIKRSGAAVEAWLLPSQAPLRELAAPRSGDRSFEAFQKVASSCSAIGRMAGVRSFNNEQLVWAYRRRLFEMGYISRQRVKLADFARYAADSLACYRGIPEFEGVLASPDRIGPRLIEVLRVDRPVQHPLTHLLIILAIFGTWDKFLEAYAIPREEPLSLQVDASRMNVSAVATREPKIKRELVAAVRDGLSPSAAARKFGVNVITSMAWLAKAGFETSTRPKKLTPDRMRRAIRILQRGGTKSSAAGAAGVSIAAIDVLLRRTPGLLTAYHEVTRHVKRKQRRDEWIKVVAAIGGRSQTEVRKEIPAVFAWLYANDRRWLNEQCEILPATSSRKVMRRVDWDKRDRALALSVRKVALTLSMRFPGKRIQRVQLCEEIFELSARLSSSGRLPLTRAAIAEVTKRRPPSASNLQLNL